MNRQYIFIDDSGDPGPSKSKTEHFIIAAILLLNDNQKQELEKAIDSHRKNLGWNPLHEFKFHTTKKDIIIDLINSIKALDFSAYAIVLDKTKITPQNILLPAQ